MSEENLIRFGECVLTLHEKLRTLVKESDLFEELNSLIHQMMDSTIKRSSAKKSRTSTYSNNGRKTSILEKQNSTRPEKVSHTIKSSNFIDSILSNRVSDFKIIKPCYVKLEKICDMQLSEHLAEKENSNLVQSSSSGLEMHCVQPIEKKSNPTKNSRPVKNIDVNVNMNIDPKLLATEDHLDLLMAKEMGSSQPQMKKIVNEGKKSGQISSMENYNLNPVVLLERLPPLFISKAIGGKLEKMSHEFNQRRKRKVSTLKRSAATNEVRRSKRSSVVKLRCSCCSKSSTGLRRSERLSHISLLTESQNSFFCNRRNSCPSRRQYKTKDHKETIISNKENLPRRKKRSNEKNNSSDDEEEFYGFENQTNNRHRIKKMKKALKTLNAQPLGKERRRILKVKDSLKLYPRPSGKENGTTGILNRDFKSLMKHTVPFKAVNRVEAQYGTSEDIKFKNSAIEDYQLSIRDNHLNVRNQMMMVQRNSIKCNDATDDAMALNRLEILKLFKKKEKLLINKMVRDQGKVIVSKTGELLNKDQFLDEPLNYYSDEYHIKKIGRRKPLWAEESIRKAIIKSQEQIPMDVIAGYFQDHNHPDAGSIAAFLGNAFLEKDEIAVKLTTSLCLS